MRPAESRNPKATSGCRPLTSVHHRRLRRRRPLLLISCAVRIRHMQQDVGTFASTDDSSSSGGGDLPGLRRHRLQPAVAPVVDADRLSRAGHPVSAIRRPPLPATHPQSAGNVGHRARAIAATRLADCHLHGSRLGQFVSMYGTCFQVVCFSARNKTILAWQLLMFSPLSSAFGKSWIGSL